MSNDRYRVVWDVNDFADAVAAAMAIHPSAVNLSIPAEPVDREPCPVIDIATRRRR